MFNYSAEELLEYLPPIKGRKDRLVDEQSTKDIIAEMLDASLYFQNDYNMLPSDSFDSLKELWQFTKRTFYYKEDSEYSQDLKSPTIMLMGAVNRTGKVDCKCFSLFIGGCIQSLGLANWRFKFVSYDNTNNYTHVYVVADNYVLDCCMNSFNQESKYTNYICISPHTNKMAINRISGLQPQRKLNYNPTTFGRQKQYGMVGEGNGSSVPKPNKQGNDKPLSPKQQQDTGISLPIPAPSISITQQPDKLGGTGSFNVKPDITFAVSLAYPISFVYGKNGGQSVKGKVSGLIDVISNTINLLSGQTFLNVSEGRYDCYFEMEVKNKKIKSNVTSFVIKSPETKLPISTNDNPKRANSSKSTIFTPTNLAIGGAVIIGGCILTHKKK